MKLHSVPIVIRKMWPGSRREASLQIVSSQDMLIQILIYETTFMINVCLN